MTDFLDVSHTVRGLPADHLDSTLRNFNWDAQTPEKKEAYLQYLRDLGQFMEDGRNEGPNLYMFGAQGNGKTHCLVAAWRWAVLRSNAGASVWVQVPKFVKRVKQGYDEEGPGPMDQIRNADVFVGLDDLFGSDLSQHEIDILGRAIDIAHTNGASIACTTNVSPKRLNQYLERHKISRLRQNCTMIKFKEGDQRL